MPHLKLMNIAQIKEADISFGDLTILVGNQATGKSIFLQIYKLIQDIGFIKNKLLTHGYSFNDFERFIPLYFGEGMDKIWNNSSSIKLNGKEFDLKDKLSKSRNSGMKNLYIPAQRVLIMEQGFVKPFTSFDISYPYIIKEFSELIRIELDKYFLNKDVIFPQANKLRKELREIVSKHIYRNAVMKIKSVGSKKQIVMKIDGQDYSVGSWSAGQKEFAPLLFGMYWALPPSKTSMREKVTTITIEEPEMGLHPRAIIDTMLLVMELLWRGYRVNISTHSNTVLELFWAINEIKKNKLEIDAFSKFIELFQLSSTTSRDFVNTLLCKNYKVYYFKMDLDGKTKAVDISNLEVGKDDVDESEWGGITSFSSRISEIISSIYEGN